MEPLDARGSRQFSFVVLDDARVIACPDARRPLELEQLGAPAFVVGVDRLRSNDEEIEIALRRPGKLVICNVGLGSQDKADMLIAERLTQLGETDAHEGPVYVADEDALYFTSVRRGTSVAIERLDLGTGCVSVVREDANVANGMTLDLEGRLVICEQGTLGQPARISRLDLATGHAETVVDAWKGLPLNSPNDVVVASDGAIWFTDPSYGHLQGFRPPPLVLDGVYRLDPSDGRLDLVTAVLDKPNGLAFSPDESILYVGDNGRPHRIVAFDVLDGRRLSLGRRLAVGTPGHPDGLKVDSEGRVYASASAGIQIFDPSGELIDELDLPDTVNFTFGGPGRDVLFITTDTAVWAASL